jgi:hypothetical protein
MNLVSTLRPFVTIAQLLAYVLVLVRMFTAGLHRTYRWFAIYIIYETIRLASFGFMHSGTKLYGYIFFFTQPITWCLYLLVILELYQLSLKNHAGIATFARQCLIGALALSTLVSVAALASETAEPGFNILRTYFLIERLIVSSLLLVLLLFTAFLAYFPVPVNRNTVVHTRIFACYFLFKTVLLVFRNLLPDDSPSAGLINIVVQLLATICLMTWSLLLSRQGEAIKSATSYRSDPLQEERLIGQLEAINRTLLSSTKK